MYILGLETSCDETAAAVIQVKNGKIKVLSNIVSSQVKLHAKWGGVVPNLAAREHLKNIIPVIEKSIEDAKLELKNIDLLAVTSGPGLIPALLIGTNAAKTLSYTTKKPLIGIHHIEGHIYANFINEISAISNFKFQISNENQHSKLNHSKLFQNSKFKIQNSFIKFPVLCLVVSGGHTQLVLMKKHLDYEIIGETLDDAAGEAFDKVARILGLGYPGGPAVAKMATEFPIFNFQFPKKFKIQNSKFKIDLPRPMINSKNFDFSFSGLKTAVLYTVKKNPDLIKDKEYIAAMCQEFQQAVVDVLVKKTIEAGKKYRPKTIMLAGGVSANLELREQLGRAIMKELPGVSYHPPDIQYSMDNAAMIAIAGYFRYKAKKNKKTLEDNWRTLGAEANLKL